ncbi:malic acid transporter Mae1 [Schizosaccharomyces japonicus yFS275]|uniref:Malic acid transporter Mae1 n=1 Tax=Schizosaccharomyces japonicus (strain yFS275 / FY16936) TaxID=402676 RepID=B6JXU3_SCHJY|nr:malic acid transporter Mae1 [Schizosaccharomyces japonicus yFS275]EEB06361.1 malic acid transporter Mae1 [Schizosaccharomyces japonicus yFS275]
MSSETPTYSSWASQRYNELIAWNVKGPRLPIAQRLKHFTWSWFTCTMATGGVGMILASLPYRFTGLNTIGKVVFIFQVVLLAIFCSAMAFRFIRYPETFKKSIYHHLEKLFIGTFLLSMSTFIDMLAAYGYPSTGEWMVYLIRIFYWMYFAVSFVYAIFAFATTFHMHPYTLETASPAWILPIFPAMISGAVAGTVAFTQPPHQLKNLVVCGIMFQGLGFWVYIMLFAVNMLKLFTKGMMGASERPGLFMFVGPPAYTGLALIGMGKTAMDSKISMFSATPVSSEHLAFMCTFMALFMWGLAAWCYCVAMVCFAAGFMSRAPIQFKLGWFAFIFPVVGFVNVTMKIGEMIDSAAFKIFGHVIGAMLAIQWMFVMFFMVRAVLLQEIMYPGRDEDVKTPPGATPPPTLVTSPLSFASLQDVKDGHPIQVTVSRTRDRSKQHMSQGSDEEKI